MLDKTGSCSKLQTQMPCFYKLDEQRTRGRGKAQDALSYKNVRLEVADTAKKRAEARRLEELRQQRAEYMSESKIERESSGVRRGSGDWQTL
jgi:hypothetical protein